MLKRTLLFFLLFLLLGGCLLLIIFVKNISNPSASPTKSWQNEIPSTQPTILSLEPISPTVLEGQINTINVVLDAHTPNDKPQLVQLEIAYDPTALSDVTITPGDFFTNATILLNTINPNTGRISYALEGSTTQQETNTNGIVAMISFIPNPTFIQPETTLSFLGKTMIQDNDGTALLTATYGTRLIFLNKNAVPGL